MTEQTETDFWAAERARDTAARGHHADPGACGTCKTTTAAGGQVEHDECAQRATLLPAPDAPSWELITGMSEEEVWALPARFHTPVFLDTCTPKAWVCAVCWGDGWNTQWPCKTAQTHGTLVFTPEHQAETTAKKQAAELAKLRAERDAFCDRVDTLTAVAKGNKRHVQEMYLELQKAQARVAELDRLSEELIGERDEMHEVADRLAYAVAPEAVIGEHSSMNDPWANALDLITPKSEVDALRARITELERELAEARRP